MKYILFVLAINCGALRAQQNLHYPKSNSDVYYSLDSNKSLKSRSFLEYRDSFQRLIAENEAQHKLDVSMAFRLYSCVRLYKENTISKDSLEYLSFKILQEAEDENLPLIQCHVLQELGNLYNSIGQHSPAIEQYLQAYSIYRNINAGTFKNKQLYLFNLGLTCYKYEDYESAREYLSEAVAVQKGSTLFCTILNTIGLAHRNSKNYDSAIHYFNLVLEEAKKTQDQVWSGISEGNIGTTYFYQKKYAEAEPLLKKDIASCLRHSVIDNAVKSMIVLSTIYIEQGRISEAERYLDTARHFCHIKKFWRNYDLAQKLYELYFRLNLKIGKNTIANIYADSALMAKDSLIKIRTDLLHSRAFENERYIKSNVATERQNAIKKQEQLKSFEQQKTLYKFIIGFLVIIALVCVFITKFRSSLKIISTDIKDSPVIVVQKMSIVYISIATCVAALVWTALYYYYYGSVLITFLPFCYFLIVAPALFYYFVTKKRTVLIYTQLFCIFFITLAIEIFSGGFKGGVVIFWAFLAPVGALLYLNLRTAIGWLVLFVSSLICLTLFHEFLGKSYQKIPETAEFMFYCMNILGPCIVIYLTMQYFVKSMIRDGILLQESNASLSATLVDLKNEKKKSDDLLLNILPSEVADELKLKGITDAKQYEHVTVLFSDFVNFTTATEKMTPQELVSELHSCFKAFDEITSRYNIEKIKTVGDAYLAASGLPANDPKHAENVVNAAIEIAQFIKRRNAQGTAKSFNIRIGVHSGPVIAGIVGVKKFAYDIWGDTVNTAARMEQNSEPGKINISESTYNLVADKFDIFYRGEINAKGKGLMKMYFVEYEG